MRKILLLISIIVFTVSANEIDTIVVNKGESDLMCEKLKPSKYPNWATQIELNNGKKVNFVSVKCMMLFYYKNTKWDDLGIRSKDDIKMLKVQDYKSLKTIDAKKAYFVFGSQIIGPKGDDLIPFQSKHGAKDFIKNSGGSKILTFDDFKLNLFDYLDM